MHRVLIALIGLVALAGCAVPDANLSYVGATLPTPAASPIAQEIADYAASVLPPAQTTLVVQPPALGQEGNDLTPAVLASLRAKGFGVAAPGTSATDTHSLRYIVSDVGKDVLLRIVVDEQVAARLYAPSSKGGLAAVSPLTATEGGS